MIKIIAVLGPTGSGKTSLAIKVAKDLKTEIISTDSVQIYKHFNIGSAKPTLEEQQEVLHHQIDVVEPTEVYSAGSYVRDVNRLLQLLEKKYESVVMVGGTGLYYRSLMYGLCETPSIPEEVKLQVKSWYQKKGLNNCYIKLEKLDFLRARELHPNDTSRILRALEVVLATGKSIKTYQESTLSFSPKFPLLSLAYNYPRPELYERINQRSLQMLEKGWLEETEELMKSYGRSIKPMKAIGYQQVSEYLSGEISYSRMVTLIQQKTRNYAKRQLTWFGKDPFVYWLNPGQYQEALVQIKSFLE